MSTMNTLLLNPDEIRLFETFSTYKIFTLELISIYCSIRKNRAKQEAANKKDKDEMSIEMQSTSFATSGISKDYELTASQELKIINLILKSIKTTDVDADTLIQSIIESSDIQTYLKALNHRIDLLSRNTLIETRNLITDLKIYFIGPQLNESLIKPWSVVGKYVRRCIIIYEKTPFEKLVALCKQSSLRFKHLTYLITKHISLLCSDKSTGVSPAINVEGVVDNNNDLIMDNSHSPTANNNSALSLPALMNDESTITVVSEWNRSGQVADYSEMDLEESLNQPNNPTSSNNPYNIRPISKHALLNNSKFEAALTSTVSAQRTHKLNLAAPIESDLPNPAICHHKPTVTFQLPPDHNQTNEEIGVDDDYAVDNGASPFCTKSVRFKERLFGSPSSEPMIDGVKTSEFEFSRKIAEYFVAKQAYLLENNEHEALKPIEMAMKIDELLAHDSSFADAYYLRFLNYLRLRDYPMALKSLHDYFDRLNLAGSVSLAALNLCSLEYRFENRENSLFALKEAITSAHQDGDSHCLQHCLSWLYKIEQFNSYSNVARRNFMIKSACSKAINNELYNLAAYNLHYYARTNVGKVKPQSIFNLLNKTDIINLKMNSKTELILMGLCHKAALWNLYGHRKISDLQCQMLLNFVPSSVNRLNTEYQCIAMCYLALSFSRQGKTSISQKIIDHCKEIYPSTSKISEHWIFAENQIQIEKYSLAGKWSMCRLYIEKLASINLQHAWLQEMNVCILEGNLEKAKEAGNKILSNSNSTYLEMFQGNSQNDCYNNFIGNNTDLNNNNTQFDFLNEQIDINLRYNYIQIYIALRDYPNALINAIKFYHEIKQLDFNYEQMVSCMIIAKILMNMEHPEQAIKYLERCMIFLMSNGSLVDQAKLHYLYSKCLYTLDKTKNLNVSISHMQKCIEKLECIHGSIYLLSAYVFCSSLYNEAGNLVERNKCAHKFRQLRKQIPLVGHLL